MKQVFGTLALVVVVVGTALGQTQKGNWQVGAQVGDFSYRKTSVSNEFTGSITPSVGYFVANNLLLGTGVPLSLTTFRMDATKSTYKGIGLAPFVRYYVGSARLKPYVGVSYSYNQINRNYSSVSSSGSSTQRTSILSPGLGLAYFVTKNVGLHAGLNYNFQQLSNEGSNTSPNSQPLSFSSDSKTLSLNIGFQLFF